MNALRSILLHVDGTPSCGARFAFARQLAVRHEAALSVMFAMAAPPRPVMLAIAESPAAFLGAADDAQRERSKAWIEAEAAGGGPAIRWVEGGGIDATAAFQRQALYADLLVLGQPGRGEAGDAPAGFVASALIDTGRPALVVPSAGAGQRTSGKVLVGWNATPQAARAVTAALPWLRAAKQVHVLEDLADPPPGGSGELDIAQYLQRHGIVASVHRQRSAPAEAGDALLSFACDVDADMLVMGCYGHSRARELVLGGATRTVLETMTLPVLMAH